MINLIAAAFGVYAALVGGLYLFQRQLIYHPSQFMASPAQAGPLAAHIRACWCAIP